MFEEFIDIGANIVFDECNLNSIWRENFIDYAKEHDYKITAIEMPKLSMNQCVKRRMNEPHGDCSKEQIQKIWKRFDSMYESPIKDEGFDEIIQLKDGR